MVLGVPRTILKIIYVTEDLHFVNMFLLLPIVLPIALPIALPIVLPIGLFHCFRPSGFPTLCFRETAVCASEKGNTIGNSIGNTIGNTIGNAIGNTIGNNKNM